MLSEEIVKSLLNLYNTFLFRKSLFDFFQKMQLDGREAARNFWDSYPCKNIFPPNVSDIFETMIDFYTNLGLVPKKRYEGLLKEQEKLHFVNIFLRKTVMQLQLEISAESGEKAHEEWENVIEGQMVMKKEIVKSFFELISQKSICVHGKESLEPCNTLEKRHEIRRMCDYPVEFILNEAADVPMEGVILNISDSGLCIHSSIPLKRGQKITMKKPLPLRHQAFAVQWSSASMTGLSA